MAEIQIINCQGAQVLPAPPPEHPLHGKYTGRLLIKADGTEHLIDAALIPEGYDANGKEV